MNWKALVDKKNAETYVLPEGWTARDKIAEQLECSSERVPELLKPGLKDGSIVCNVFPVWDRLTKRIVRVSAYRDKPIPVAKKAAK